MKRRTRTSTPTQVIEPPGDVLREYCTCRHPVVARSKGEIVAAMALHVRYRHLEEIPIEAR